MHHFTAQTLELALTTAGLRPTSIRTAALFGVIPASIDAWTCGGARQRGWGASILVRVPSYPIELALASAGMGEGLLAIATPADTRTAP